MGRCGAWWRSWLTLVLLLGPVRTSLALQLTGGPYVQQLTGTSATVAWDTDISAGCSLEIEPVGGVTTTIGGAAAKHCEFPLQSLTPETTYRYVAKGNGVALATAQLSTLPQIQTVFIILMENHSWSAVKSAPYIAHLAATGAHAENYRTPIHPSEPNYVILEAGTNCPPLADGTAGHCFTTDGDPTGSNHTASPFHLVRYLEEAGISWKAYQEGISGSNCPLTRGNGYAPKHVGTIFFDDVTGASNPSDPHCIEHFRPYDELASDLAANTVARYNFITPNLCHDMHDCSVTVGDTWLSQEVPHILGSAAYQNHGLLILTWDEDSGTPIGMILQSSAVKPGYSNTIAYAHPSTVRTLQEIFGVVPPQFPWLGDAATATDLSDLFAGGNIPVTTTTTRPASTTTTRPSTTTTSTTRPPTTTTTSRPSVTSTTRPATTTTTTTTVVPFPTTTSTTPPPETSLVNGGFEQGQTGWVGWTSPQNAGEAVLTTVGPCAGLNGLHMFDSATRTRSVFQDVAVEAGQPIALRFLARARNLGTEQARAVLEWHDGAGALGVTVLTLPAETYGCTPFALDARAPAGATSVRVSLGLGPVTDGVPHNDAEVWYDEVALAPHLISTTTTSVPSTTTTTLPRPTSCLGGTGPLSIEVGTHTSRVTFGEDTLKPGLRIDARGATFLASMSNLYPLVLDRGSRFFMLPDRQEPPNVCVAGGTFVGQFPRSETWAQSKAHSGAGIEFWPGALTIEGARIDNVHDGIRPLDGNNWTIRGADLSYIRDDCVENDHMRSGTITDSLFDGCYVFVSTRPSSTILSEGWDGTNEVVRVENSLVHMQPMPGPVTGTLDPGWGTTWKWHTGTPSKSPRLSLHGNIFRYDQVGGSGAASMELPPGKLLDCSDNVVVWLGPGEFPARLPSCFKVTKDPAVWDKAVAAWKATHP